MEFISLDAIDLQLLNLLQTDVAQNDRVLVEQMHMSPPICLRHARHLHDVGLVERQVAILQPDRLAALQGHGPACTVEVSLDRRGVEQLDASEAYAAQEAAVQQCWRVSPGPDSALMVHMRDMPDYLALSQRLFTGDANVRSVRAFFATRRAKFETKVPVAPDWHALSAINLLANPPVSSSMPFHRPVPQPPLTGPTAHPNTQQGHPYDWWE